MKYQTNEPDLTPEPTDPDLAKQFAERTLYLFEWEECETLLRPDSPIVYAESISLEEALDLIEIGYTAIPY